VASSAVGSKNLYEFLNDNPGIEFLPSDYVNDPGIIARHHKMVSMSVPMVMDLTGQVAADALYYNHYSGVTGMLDFIRGAARSDGGKSILMFPSTYKQGTKSRIVPMLRDTAIVVPRGDVQYVVTEYGAVNLFGKSLQERAMAMISLAHPEFREELFHEAKKAGLLGSERTLSESISGIYPVKLEETIEIEGDLITFRPAKPVDDRRIQEHFYNLDKEDIFSRFFNFKTSFVRDDVEGMFQIDYINNLTLLAVVGEFGFGKVVAAGEYYLDQDTNMAEIAFSVDKAWQGKGLGKILIKKLSGAARENGIAGLTAYTLPGNRGMVRLFKTMPYKITSVHEGDVIELTCRFDELA
jgi:GNAT superfamily N-acetyltransferase